MNGSRHSVWFRNLTCQAVVIAAFLTFLLLPALAAAQKAPKGNKGAGGQKEARESNRERGPKGKGPSGSTFCTEVPPQTGSVVLGRPDNNSVVASILMTSATQALLVWGEKQETFDTAPGRAIAFKAGEPREIILDGLRSDTRYYYELRDAASRKRLLPLNGPGTFHTARPANAAFTFTITADPHLDEHTSPDVYARTLKSALAESPDFHVDLGDTFMTEKHASRDSAFRQYLAQRYYFGLLCHSAPLFFVLGNHDGEYPRGKPGSDMEELAVWSNLTRKHYFPNPVPGSFYSGNAKQHPQAGLLQNYYSWEWGGVLFIALDPYWFGQEIRGSRDNWKRTLGAEQYQWLKRTLEQSSARFKFVFIHHLTGGATPEGRGGTEAAPFYEWGGKNADGSDGFKENRPGWTAPIHQLLKQNHVQIVFHGHDHLFAKQDYDGIVYQEVAQPGDPNGSTRSAEEYSYKSGVLLGSPGYMRVSVNGETAKVDYLRPDRTLAHSFTIRQ